MIDIFSKGSCFNFHLILRTVYPQAEPYYNGNHIVTKIDNKLYDINGVVHNRNNQYRPLAKMFHKKELSRVISQMLKYEHKLTKK